MERDGNSLYSGKVGGKERSQEVCVVGFFSTINLVTEIYTFEIALIQCRYHFSFTCLLLFLRDKKMEIRI